MDYNKDLYTHKQWSEHMRHVDIFGIALSIDEKTNHRVDIFYSGLDKRLRIELYERKNIQSWMDVIEGDNNKAKTYYVDSKEKNTAMIIEETLALFLMSEVKKGENKNE